MTSRSFIVPFVGVLPGPAASSTRAGSRSSAVLHVPLAELLPTRVYREERWGIPPQDRPIYFFEIVGDTIWGATAGDAAQPAGAGHRHLRPRRADPALAPARHADPGITRRGRLSGGTVRPCRS